MITWSKGSAEAVQGSVGPFVAKLARKGDGRWDWKIYADGAENPLASGVSRNVGEARTKCEQFVGRSGRI